MIDEILKLINKLLLIYFTKINKKTGGKSEVLKLNEQNNKARGDSPTKMTGVLGVPFRS